MSERSRAPARAGRYAPWLWALLALFCLRVGGQALVATLDVDFLPPMEEWYSGLVPYGPLLLAQVLIIAGLGTISTQFTRGSGFWVRPRRGLGLGLWIFGWLYAGGMVVRYAVRMTLHPEARWLGGTIPIVFHLVLASYVLLVAHFHRCGLDSAEDAPRSEPSPERATWLSWVAYPGVIGAAFVLHALLVRMGLSVGPSAYLAVVLGAVLVTGLERLIPYNRAWLPTRTDVKNDLLFMVLVQVALPPLLALVLGLTLIRGLDGLGLAITGWWPGELPVAVQIALMLLVAEFFRYWLHVACHNTSLWRLHAVHHSPKKLYWLNVGRFHPVEKALQYLLDALPFILLGVGEAVLAGYFIFYAVNGFFQHSNVHARYGVLNYVISSAELHRWHHSRRIEESNHNYGNNLILWDLVFGSWFLPRGRSVGELGLVNRDYPLDFISQMTTPLRAGLDKQTASDAS